VSVLGALVIGGLLLASAAIGQSSGQAPASNRVTAATVQPSVPSDPNATTASDVLPVPEPGLAQLTVAGPPGFASRPAWAVQVAAWTRSVAADDGTILTRNPDGYLLLLDPATGAVRWRSSAATSSGQEGPWLATIDGARVAVVVGGGALSYWALPALSGPTGASGGMGVTGGTGKAVGSGTSVRLPAGAKVTWAGPSPLVTTPKGDAGVIRARAVVPVSLPTGARALAADGSTVLAVTGSTFVRRGVSSAGVKPRAFPRPAGAGARPLRVEPVGSAFLLTVWPRAAGRGQIVCLVDTTSGKIVVQTALAATVDLTHAAIVREQAGAQTLLGPVLVDTYTANLDLLDPRYSVRSVTRGHAWAMFQGRATDIQLDRAGSFRTVSFPSGEPALPIGVVAPARGRVSTAVVVVPSSRRWVLCGLPASA
jgi:hypothetical protein